MNSFGSALIIWVLMENNIKKTKEELRYKLKENGSSKYLKSMTNGVAAKSLDTKTQKNQYVPDCLNLLAQHKLGLLIRDSTGG